LTPEKNKETIEKGKSRGMQKVDGPRENGCTAGFWPYRFIVWERRGRADTGKSDMEIKLSLVSLKGGQRLHLWKIGQHTPASYAPIYAASIVTGEHSELGDKSDRFLACLCLCIFFSNILYLRQYFANKRHGTNDSMPERLGSHFSSPGDFVILPRGHKQITEPYFRFWLAFFTYAGTRLMNQLLCCMAQSRNRTSLPASDAFLAPGGNRFSLDANALRQTPWFHFL
jgi:hypothetical protein